MKPPNDPCKNGLSTPLTLLICLLSLLIAAAGAYFILSTEPVAERETATRKSAMLVDTINVQRGTFRPVIVENGIVTPSKEIELSTQVDGQILQLHPEFVPGGYVKKGDVLIHIDPADYENLLTQRQSELKQAETELQLEMGRQKIAQKDFELLRDNFKDEDTALVLRQPQLKAAEVRVEAATAAVAKAQIDLERTQVKATFDAQILDTNVNVGSQVSSGMNLAELIGIENYWVIATVPVSKLPFLEFTQADSRNPGALAELSNRAAWPASVREGRLSRLIAALDGNTRLARVIIEVDDPLARKPANKGKPTLLIGEYLEVRIHGKALADVVRLERDFLRENDTAWIMDADGRLRIRNLDIVFKDAEYAYVLSGLDEGDAVVTTNLTRVTDGAELRLANQAPQN